MNPDKNLPLWKIDSSKYIVNDRFLKLRADNCTTPRGDKINTYYVHEYDDWVNCIAIDEDDNVMMLCHYRHGIGKYVMEFAAGGIETGEQPEAAARRELQEETGYIGGSIFHVGSSYVNPANHTNQVHTYLAVGGDIGQPQNLEAGETIYLKKIPLSVVIEEMSKPGAVYPSFFTTALFHAMNFLRASDDPALAHLKRYLR